ncbi:hypothetical protein PanWU01x14_067640 [Parasponia andersonii]|uniref:Uncharacterized protein n=1 Tax=Parasponia andersonii TaxID=3476 RepID=A0A2P5DF62_PARAD|nr:hypothetical protein PanWU01x14_067640 [Parasponia andersonii]
MGGCASKPKECGIRQRQPVPSEAPASPKPVEAESVAQEKTNDVGESQNEAHLVDLSKPKKEEGENSAETKAVEAEVVMSTEATGDLTPEVAEDKAEATIETPKEDKVKVEAIEETEETPKEEQVEAKKAEDLDPTPASEDKSAAPVVTL